MSELVERFFTHDLSGDVYSLFKWAKFDARIENYFTGEVAFEQKDVEFPEDWSVNAINIVSQKYFCGTPGTPTREYSLKQLVNRVADTITKHGRSEGYFTSEEEAKVFNDELKFILTDQKASFNSPVWFNIGAPERSQQASACFILSVDDTMESILEWYRQEGMIFKGGSGAGANISKLRSSKEGLGNSGGTSSGPVSFMRGADSVAGTIKSGGKTRRAAKMVILNVDHPDIEEFIWCKAIEERKSRVLKEAGFDMDLDGKDAFSVQYQNANNSVRVSDEFMKAVESGADWNLLGVTDGEVKKTLPARDLWRQIAESAWECADPGLQYDTTINHWHTTPNAGRINASNPCSEYMHLDDSACNLASINLLKFLNEDGSFDAEAYRQVIRVVFLAQEILVGYSEYPTEKIAKNAKAFRELGLGYANLGALLMGMGLPYDSDEGRAVAATLTAIMTGEAYAKSAQIAKVVGPFDGYEADKEGMNRVLEQHQAALKNIDKLKVELKLNLVAEQSWENAVKLGRENGVRNSQATVLAPTGTIAFMMDCDTTGIEPDLALVKTKKLVGGGTMSIVNRTIPLALKTLGYDEMQVDEIIKYIDEEKTIVGAPHLKKEHYPVFACSMGDNVIHYTGHVRMMGAVQPFLSGAISKTVNMPEEASVEDVEEIHMLSWKEGLKAVAIYRDNCKVAQPLSTTKKDEKDQKFDANKQEESSSKPAQVTSASPVLNTGTAVGGSRKLPKTRTARTFEFKVADCKGYVTVGEFEDGTPAEIFLQVSKQGSTLAGIMDSFAISISRGLRNGVPLKSYVSDFIGMSFAPAGITDDPDIRTASSLMDYIFRRIAKDYLSLDDQLELGIISMEDLENHHSQASLLGEDSSSSSQQNVNHSSELSEAQGIDDSYGKQEEVMVQEDEGKHIEETPLCFNCGNITQRAGSCYVCTACGSTSGCS
ncbi:MAG: vitamin B12-dependent ribonucleotide reductase [Candidatus Nomurabacteria bacterium]|nr:MAG: vitamin B12-dependent ribonucleotide reductase [Candidatus Nomurabacteria bacterium]HRV75758.1 vitamin B12-dependent ribonucleotide reductase [Candidatus Saccharimonadales bacterium]